MQFLQRQEGACFILFSSFITLGDGFKAPMIIYPVNVIGSGEYQSGQGKPESNPRHRAYKVIAFSSHYFSFVS